MAASNEESRPRFEDKTLVHLHALVAELLPTELSKEAFDFEADSLSAAGPSAQGVLEGRECFEFLDELRTVVRQHISAQSRAFSSARWLWYLRRLPTEVFEGELESTLVQDELLATVCSGDGGPERQLAQFESGFAYPLTPGIVKRILRFCRSAVLLAACQAAMRRAAKGTPYRVSPHHWPVAVPCPEIEEAVAIYDRRMIENRFGYYARAGVPLSNPSPSWAFTPSSVLAVGDLREWQWLPTVMGPLSGNHEAVEVYGRHVPYFLEMPDLHGLALEADLVSDSQLLVATLATLRSLAEFSVYSDSLWANVTRYGYHVLPESAFVHILRQSWTSVLDAIDRRWLRGAADLEPDALLERLTEHQGNDHPLTPGPLVRREGTRVLVDVRAATILLSQLVGAVPRGGAGANVRAAAFERAVQDVIDRSPWRPSVPVRQLVGRELRRSGQSLTDIDAIATKDEVLLLVDCGSFPYTADYDIGDHAAVRNRAEQVTEKVEKWQRIVEDLRASPTGDNFDLRSWKLSGVVVTPFPVYVPSGPATRDVYEGLPAASAVAELERFVEQ